MPVMTKTQKAEALKHILETLFGLEEGNPVASALTVNGLREPLDIMLANDKTLDSLNYKNDKEEYHPLPVGYCNLLKIFKEYVAHHISEGNSMENEDWVKLDVEDFRQFRLSSGVSSSTTSSSPSATSSTHGHDPLRDFRRGIKRDTSVFPILRDDAAWDNWQ